MALELWRKRTEQESFNNTIIPEIDLFKQKLKRRIQSLRVEGSHREANRSEETLACLERVEKSMKRLLGEA